MNKMLFVMLVALTVAGISAKGQDKPVLVVAPVEISRDFLVPSDWLADFGSRLVELLKYSQKFGQVIAPGDTAVPDGAESLHVTIVAFRKGNRALRYAVGFGAGQEKMKATVVWTGRTERHCSARSSAVRRRWAFTGASPAKLQGSWQKRSCAASRRAIALPRWRRDYSCCLRPPTLVLVMWFAGGAGPAFMSSVWAAPFLCRMRPYQ